MALSACSEFMDVKPDKSLSVPETLEDFALLLDDPIRMNMRFASSGEVGSDNVLVLPAVWNGLTSPTARALYVWGDDLFNEHQDNDWSFQYIRVFSSNVALDGLDNYDVSDEREQEQWNQIRGSALFFRSISFYSLLTHFAKPFDPATAGQDPGIALRLSSDMNLPSQRASVQESYERVINDLREAAELLPERVEYLTCPSRYAAWALLARVYLSMELYSEAEACAIQAMEGSATLLDYNELDLSQPRPIPNFNEETLFWATLNRPQSFTSANARIDTALYATYDEIDLRKAAFGELVNDGYHRFSGSYDGQDNYFCGLALDELVLIRAECSVRAGRIEEALTWMDELLQKRYKTGSYQRSEVSSLDAVLDLVLLERRKELLFRSLRWEDLRRLNRDLARRTTIRRVLDGEEYTLEPGSNRYVWPLPEIVVQSSEMPQNER